MDWRITFTAILWTVLTGWTSAVFFPGFQSEVKGDSSSGERAYQIQGIVDDIFPEYWILQTENDVFKFKINWKGQNLLKGIHPGDSVTVIYRMDVVHIIPRSQHSDRLFREAPQRKDSGNENINKISPKPILDDRAFFEA